MLSDGIIILGLLRGGAVIHIWDEGGITWESPAAPSSHHSIKSIFQQKSINSAKIFINFNFTQTVIVMFKWCWFWCYWYYGFCWWGWHWSLRKYSIHFDYNHLRPIINTNFSFPEQRTKRFNWIPKAPENWTPAGRENLKIFPKKSWEL